jgi:hypothetical protein
MVVTKLYGGLGNQMFQYAVGRTVSLLNNNSEFFLDVSWFKKIKGNTQREYELGPFNIVEKFASKKEIAMLGGSFLSLRSKLGLFKSGYVREKGFDFDPNVMKLTGDIYLDGYWQSERYFKDIESTIRGDFILKNPLSKNALEIYSQIKNTNSISVHIRRGDYVTDPSTNDFHGVCSIDYYKRAQEILKNIVSSPHFFVFSDDIEWVKKNITFCGPVFFVSGCRIPDYEEITLMSYCKHHIVANSSFSWWGAWLNPSREKIVIAPKKWFNNSDINTSDLVPKSWNMI